MSIDIEEATAQIAGDLFGGGEAEPPDTGTEAPIVEGREEASSTTAPVVAPVARSAPKAWAKDYHEPFSKLDPKVQDYIDLREKQMLEGLDQYREHSALGKSLREVISPYKAMIAAAGIDEAKAVSYLMNAHYKMTNGTPEQRLAFYHKLGADFGLIQRQQQAQVDPKYQELETQVQKLTSSLTARERAEYESTKSRITTDVTSFADAKDEKGNALHPHFDDVADDIVIYIGAGATLQEAYDKAVYANPVTRAKQIAALRTEEEAKLRGKSKQEVDAARRATSTNVRSRDTGRAPTEPLGKMEDTMRETLKNINSRTSH